MDQNKTPFLDALKKYVDENVSPFDVPGHHMGNAENEFKNYIGQLTYTCDVNAPRGLDNLNHPNGVIEESMKLMADCYKADEAFFLINGTSSGILAMIMSTVKAHEEIILPRNVHKSVINALILAGAIPVFVVPQFDKNLEISNQPTVEDYIKKIESHPYAKAVFVINPTYFGAVNDLKAISKVAHEKGMLCLADEAHGAHLGFTDKLPISAMEADFDLSAVSMHKTAGALTQASVLLRKGNRVSHYDVFKALMVVNTNSFTLMYFDADNLNECREVPIAIKSFSAEEAYAAIASSASQLVFDLITNTKLKMNKEIAGDIFIGIISDTHRFLFDYTTIHTYEVVITLIKKYKINQQELYSKLYARPLSEVKLMGYISSNLIVNENKFAYIILDDEVLKEFGTDSSACSNMINDFGNINEVLVWIFVSRDNKNKDILRLNIRSRGPIVNEFAENYGGGGHKYASGIRLHDSEKLDEVLDGYNNICKNYIEEQNNKIDK